MHLEPRTSQVPNIQEGLSPRFGPRPYKQANQLPHKLIARRRLILMIADFSCVLLLMTSVVVAISFAIIGLVNDRQFGIVNVY